MFEKILGNQKIKERLEKLIHEQRILHSYLFIGIEGIGKRLIAKDFAKGILCINEKKYCNNCKSCIEFNSNNNPDFSYIEPDGNNIKIEQIREMQKRIQEKPIISQKKVYIIDNADKMTKEAQNCLLKTLEEPPEFATIILIGSNENAFLSTIKSRCMILHFMPISNEEISNYLKLNHGIENINKDILDTFEGSIGKAIKLKDKQEEYLKIKNIIDNLEKTDLIETINQSEILYKSKEEITEFLDYINILLLKKAKEQYKYTNCINIVENTKKRIRQNANYDMCIDNMLFNMWEEIN